jgi:periplasmic protein TonB
MATVVQSTDIDENRVFPVSSAAAGSAKDRLTTTLFLAGLFHAILIIGVSFVTPPPAPPSAAPSLNVVMLTDETAGDASNSKAEYLAQRNQAGNGNVQNQTQPASPVASPLAAALDGSAAGNGAEFHQALSDAASTEVLSSRSQQADLAFQSGTPEPASASETPLALTPTPPNPISTSKVDSELRLHGRQTRELYVTPDTKESRLAPYLDGWRHKIEKIGTLNYPNEARRKGKLGNPVLEVVIRADGSLGNVLVRRSSGDRAIDQAALGILKLAAPFDPFPRNLHRDYEQLRFAYEWQFLGGRVTANAVSEP